MGKYKRLEVTFNSIGNEKLLRDLLDLDFIEYVPPFEVLDSPHELTDPEETASDPEDAVPAELKKQLEKAQIAYDAVKKYGNIKEAFFKKKIAVTEARFWGDTSIAERACTRVCELVESIAENRGKFDGRISSSASSAELDAELWAIEGEIFSFADLCDEIEIYIDRLRAESCIGTIESLIMKNGDLCVLKAVFPAKKEDDAVAFFSRHDCSWYVADLDRHEKHRSFDPLIFDFKYAEIIKQKTISYQEEK